jgi:Predicted metal-dependent hydrolase of the TIM-barrel fold
MSPDDRDRIDTHVHLWSDDQLTYPFTPYDAVPWPDEASPLSRWREVMTDHGIRAAVVIQPRFYGPDHGYLLRSLELLDHSGSPAAGIALVNPLRVPDPIFPFEELIERGVRGVRLVALQRSVAEWERMLSAEDFWSRMRTDALPVSVLVTPEHLPALHRAAGRHEDVRFVIDHMGLCRPDDEGDVARLEAFAELPNVTVKVSALGAIKGTERDGLGPGARLARLVAVRFGAARLIAGTDFPHCYDYGGYAHAWREIEGAIGAVTATDTAAVLAENARALFRLSC